MIGLWLLYATLVGALAALAASLAQRVLLLWRLPVRMVWALAMALSIVAPVALWLRPAPEPPVTVAELPAMVIGTAVAAAPAEPGVVDQLATMVGGIASRLAPLDRPLLLAWALTSAALIATLGRSALRLRRRRREWTARELDGVPVLVAPDTGPAVVGGGRLGVVLPSWALELDAPLRRLVLRHELEHLKAGDPHLLLAGVAAVVLAPWNLALWWQLGRLRLAVELDCDRRVLQAHGDVERYGLLLMAVGQRGSGLLRLATPALSEPTTTLERRIDAMTARPPRRRLVVAATLTAGAALVTAAACVVPSPNSVSGPNMSATASRQSVDTAASPAPVVDANQTFFEFQVEKPAVQLAGGGGPTYPSMLQSQGVNGRVVAQFVVDTNGVPEVNTFEVLESTHDLFTASVRRALPQMRFTPAEVGGKRVKQMVQQPFVFEVATPLLAPGNDSVVATPRASVLSPTPLRRSGAIQTVPDSAKGFFEFQIDKPAVQLPGYGSPTYPSSLQAEGISGKVVAQFVVNEDGTADVSTFRVLESDHELFTAAVRRALPQMRFRPAMVGDRAVRQIMQQPFVFGIK